ncbi:hypothetical protein QR680_008872 [Steinernema hermaphroditum]|uniref:Calmodulin-binding domain-containing protein n=1 Tax=Steinernema hermaphroditum TaxID=289476 RepID=A0AA39IKN7_9BILA|nr:hypothetical protein QR680_008872 [Steinernema hermaphroditum]
MVERPLLAPPCSLGAAPEHTSFYRCSPVSSITELDESCPNESEDSGNVHEESVFPEIDVRKFSSKSSFSSLTRVSLTGRSTLRPSSRTSRFVEGGRMDPGKFRLSVNKQRSNSECVFNKTRLNGVQPANGLIRQEHIDRRCSIAVLNREQAILRRILGPNGLSWLSRDQLSRKSLSLVLSEDLEAQQAQMDDMKTPLMKEEKGGRLIQRQHLFHARRVTSDFALFFSLFGIVMMVLENELSAAHICEKGSFPSRTLKIGIAISTAILVMLVIRFHIYEVQLFMNANSAEDWRIAFTWRRIVQIAVEILACGICPLPFDITFIWTTVHADGVHVSDPEVSVDVLLSIPMFFRLYWLCRVMLLHSRMFTDASSRSIAGLNRVNFNARFILKTLMTMCPGTIMLFFTASLWVIAAWIMRLCERYHALDEAGQPTTMQALKHQNYLNSLWLIAITFLSVGYGDIVPNTYCGRSMAVITGILGTCTSSMVVAVIARKLELSRAEKHVQNFMMDTHLTKMLKHSAANVLRETWLIYKYRRLVDKIDPGKIRMHQRKFLVAIYELRKVKRDQRKLAENSVSLGDVAKTTSNTYEMIHDVHSTQEGLSLRMTAVEHQLSDIQRELSSLAEMLRAKYMYEDTATHPPSPVDPLRRRRAVAE